MTTRTHSREVLSFGPFALVPSERLLTRAGTPVNLGARAYDILIALVTSPNELITKDMLFRQVWPDVTVEEGSLRFHIAGLRKALGDGKDGARYITTLPGRGYCFVAPVARSDEGDAAELPTARVLDNNLPARPIGMLGRDDDIARLSNLLGFVRLVTVVGAGGIGKTTVAAALGHHMMKSFAGAVLFVDLGMLSDPRLAPTATASMLGLSVQSADATPALVAYLRDRRLLLVLDTCEHLIEAVAALASRILAEAPRVQILATSRETLQVEGEHVYRLEPLACPPDDPGLTAAVARTFPATQLFVERAVASGARLDLSDDETAIMVAICRKLDGVALAIELAARRVGSYGLAQTAQLLDQRLTLLWVGPRTAPARQKTLQATLDWSYGLLSEIERVVLRRLAIFVGHFSLDAALAVVTSKTVDHVAVFSAIDSLVAKSMVATRPVGAMMRYRLLDTTRAYALEMSATDRELSELAVRHATYYRRWLEQLATEGADLSSSPERGPTFAALNNVRAALEWCFGVDGNVEAGTRLAAAAAPVFLAMSLLPECRRWSERGLAALDPAAGDGGDEMHLTGALGMSLMFMSGGSETARLALDRSLEIAEARGDSVNQLRLLSRLHMFHTRFGDFKTALGYARRGVNVVGTIEEPAARALAHCVLGMALRHVGDQNGARAELETALQHSTQARGVAMYVGYDPAVLANVTLAIVLWLQGYPDQAVARAHRAVAEAEALDHPVTLAIALCWAAWVFLRVGDLDTADQHTERFLALSQSHTLGTYLAIGRAYRGVHDIRRGNADVGVESLRHCLSELDRARYRMLNTEFEIALAQGLLALGRVDEALSSMDETIRSAEANAALSYMPELLRIKGTALLAATQPDIDAAANCFLQSLDWSRRQAARSWELRTATDLAALWLRQSRPDAARAALQPVFEQFREGFGTADLRSAKASLDRID